jgi:acyl-CoA thioester hydrolase
VSDVAVAQSFYWPIRVYYEDTDAGGVVFYANYLKFFERARTEWLRAAGINQSVLADDPGIVFVVARTAVDYHFPARLDNRLKVSVKVEKFGRASVDFIQKAWRIDEEERRHGVLLDGEPSKQAAESPGEMLIATGTIRVVCVDQKNLRPCTIPQDIRSLLAENVDL